MEQNKMTKYGVLVAAGVASVLIGGCGTESSVTTPADKKVSNEMEYMPPQINTKELLAKAKDGTFSGISDPDDRGAYGKISITIKDHQIIASTFEGYKKDGTLKDESYGKTNGEIENKIYYNKAQLAVSAIKSYGEAFLQTQELNKVDGISGATVSYKQFFEAAQRALEQASL